MKRPYRYSHLLAIVAQPVVGVNYSYTGPRGVGLLTAFRSAGTIVSVRYRASGTPTV